MTASNCPWATEFKPPLTISAITEEVKKINAMEPLNNNFTSTDVSPNIFLDRNSGTGKNTRQMNIHNSRGVFLKTSI
jgi:hypothetical protein